METQPVAISAKPDPRVPIFRHRPALALLIAILAGVASSYSLEPTWVFTATALIVCGALQLLHFIRSFKPYRNGLALLLAASLGFALYTLSASEFRASPLAQFAERATRGKVTGIVNRVESLRNGTLILIDVNQVATDSITLPMEGRLAASVGEPGDDMEIPLPLVGDTITLFATIQPLRAERNPYAGSYDERLEYSYGVNATADLESRFDYYISNGHQWTVWTAMDRASERLRQKAEKSLDACIADTQAAAFVKAVVLGTRSELDQQIVVDFKYSGLTHLLAISGFNIAVVSLLIAQGLLLFGVRRRSIRMPITAIAVAFYCFVIGLQPSVLRAFIMIELYLLANALERKPDLANITALTAVVHILIDPMVVHDAGFQLSYAAVFGFALIQPELVRLLGPNDGSDEEHGRTFLEWLRHSLILSLAAFIATAPVLIYHFRQITLVVTLANLIAIPIAGAITALGFVLIPLSRLLPWVASLYGDFCTWLVDGLLWLSSFLASIGKGGISIGLNATALIMVTIAIIWILRARSLKPAIGRGAIASAALATMFLIIPASRSQILTEGKLSLIFSDVGQGDAMVLKTPSGKFYLFDFGPLSGSDVHFAARPYGPLLQIEHATAIEAGFVTHLHRDHYGGLYSAVFSNDIKSIYTVGDRTGDEFAYELDSMVREHQISVDRLHVGQILTLDEGVKLYVLSPDSTETRNEIENDRSLVLKLVYGNTSCLLLGDIEAPAEQELVSRYGDMLRSDIVKVAHHGSISSSTRELVNTTHTNYAIISCGRNNRFGHPHRAVVSRWMRAGADVLRTDQEGAIIFESDGEKLTRVNWRE